MGEPSSGIRTPGSATEQRLDSWKEIAAYLNRDVTTVQRWERREGMPVHRHLHDKRGSVYALSSELDAWVLARKPEVSDEEPASEAHLPQAEPTPRAGWYKRRPFLLGSAAALIVLLVAGYFAARVGMAKPIHPKIKSLAVLPLQNLSGDPDQEFLADGMTEELIGRLAGIRQLRVVSRTSTMTSKNPTLRPGNLQAAPGGCDR
jgi:hypothetical protein